jgi:hypothetical protein
LIIVSKFGIYATHYWETIAFDPEQWDEEDQEDPLIRFERVLGSKMEQGVLGQMAPLRGAVALMDSSLRAFLFIPDEGAAEVGQQAKQDPFRLQWNALKAKVGSIVPSLWVQPENNYMSPLWKEIVYHPVQKEEVIKEEGHIVSHPLLDKARGRYLVQYDPDHNGKKKVTMWIEKKPVYNFEWN